MYEKGPAFPQVDPRLRCPLTDLMDTVVYVDEHGMPRSDVTNAHAHLDICCSHMTKEPFSNDTNTIEESLTVYVCTPVYQTLLCK